MAEMHRMLPGSHERPGGAECFCGAAWSRWGDRCHAEESAKPVALTEETSDTDTTPEASPAQPIHREAYGPRCLRPDCTCEEPGVPCERLEPGYGAQARDVAAARVITIRITNHGPWHGHRAVVAVDGEGNPPAELNIEADRSITDGSGRVIGALLGTDTPRQEAPR